MSLRPHLEAERKCPSSIRLRIIPWADGVRRSDYSRVETLYCDKPLSHIYRGDSIHFCEQLSHWWGDSEPDWEEPKHAA